MKEGQEVAHAGRLAHRRHRAARSPAHRQAAARPLRPAGRSRLEPLLPVAGRRPDAHLRRRMGEERAHPARHGGGRGDRKPAWSAAASRPPRRRSRSSNFDIRKNLLEYDEVMDEQRKRVYGYRQEILDGAQLQAVDPGHDRRADRRAHQRVSGPGLRRRHVRPVGQQHAGIRAGGGQDSRARLRRGAASRPRRGPPQGRRPGLRSDRREPARG